MVIEAWNLVIFLTMHPILIRLGFIQIYSYGLMVALAFLVSTFLLSRKADTLGFFKDFSWNLSFWSLLGGILGGRIGYIILNYRFFLENPRELILLWHGGLVWYGGFLGGFLFGALYLKFNRIPLVRAIDLIIPFIALGQAIGRIGCFLNGCCYGKTVEWGIYFPAHNDYLIPTQLFSSLSLLIIFVVLRILQERPHRNGFILAVYLLASSFERFLIEFLRDDSKRSYFGLTIFQIISLVIFFSAICLMSIILASKKRNQASA